MNDKARGTLQIGIRSLLHKYPLLGGIVSTWNLVMDDSIGTMAIGFEDEKWTLYFDPTFVGAISIEELEGVLHHEARHVIFGHPFMPPEDFEDEHALTIAQEVTVNEGIPEPLPGDPITLKHYPLLKPNEDTVARYDKLRKPCKKRNPDPNGGAKSGQPSDKDEGESNTLGDSNSIDALETKDTGNTNRTGSSGPKKPSQSSNGAGKSRSGKNKPNGPQNGSSDRDSSQPIDNHSKWNGAKDNADLAKGILDATIQEVRGQVDHLGEYEKGLLEQASREWGSVPGTSITDLHGSQSAAKVKWEVLLRRYVGDELDRSPSYMRPARRFPNLLGVVPGTLRSSIRPKILAVVDTSSSMTDEMLEDVSRELSYLGRDREVRIVECDCAIQRVYRMAGPIKKVAGRGGTDFRPPLASPFLKKERPDLVIIFSDGAGPAPEKPPQVPVIWALTPGGEAPVKWGKVVKMGEDPPLTEHVFWGVGE